MLLFINYSPSVIYRMALKKISPKAQMVGNVAMALLHMTMVMACGWAEILLLLSRWMAQKASAKWIPGLRATALELVDVAPVVAENLAYDILDGAEFIWLVTENALYDGLEALGCVAEYLSSAWSFRAEILAECRG